MLYLLELLLKFKLVLLLLLSLSFGQWSLKPYGIDHTFKFSNTFLYHKIESDSLIKIDDFSFYDASSYKPYITMEEFQTTFSSLSENLSTNLQKF